MCYINYLLTTKVTISLLKTLVLFATKEKNKMLITIARLTGSIATGIALNLFVNHLKAQKIRKEIKNDRK